MSGKSLWRVKSLTHNQNMTGLKRVFGPWHLIALGVGVTIGAGLFSLTGVAAGQLAGPAVMISFLISAIACGFAGLCYAELAGMISSGGSAYSYSYASLGEVIAWTIGWDLILEYTVGAAAIASSWASYFASLLRGWGIMIDPRLLATPGTSVTLPDGSVVQAWFNAPAVFIVWIMTALLMRGTSEASKFNTVIVTIKLSVIACVIIACTPFVHMGNYHPFIPPNEGHFGAFGWSGIMRAAGLAFFAYLGFDIISTTAQDTRDPQRNIPIGMLGSQIICGLVYVVFSAILVGVVSYRTMADDPSPVATAMDTVHMPWLASLVKLGVTIGYLAVIYGLLLGQSRICMAMAHDGLVPGALAKLNAGTRTPWTAHLLTALAASVLAAILPIAALGNMTSIGTLLAFIIVCIGVVVLRLKRPEAKRVFRVPGGPFLVPALGILSCGAVMASIDGVTWLRLIIWLIAGAIIYSFYGLHHSHLRHHPETACTPPTDPG